MALTRVKILFNSLANALLGTFFNFYHRALSFRHNFFARLSNTGTVLKNYLIFRGKNSLIRF
jgi:hypothetical protein